MESRYVQTLRLPILYLGRSSYSEPGLLRQDQVGLLELGIEIDQLI